MQLFREVDTIRTYLANHENHLVKGLVPTMGALHEGHMALLEASRKDNDLTICSIYVNPTQFNDTADLEKYPRNLEKDLELLDEAGCDAVFCPSDQAMYPRGRENVLQMNFRPIDQVLEGAQRPGHFQGVRLVVAKLLNIVEPDRAYFGQKDLQQFAVIQQLVSELFIPVELIRVPIVRNQHGLALSSRNQRLSPAEKQLAAQLSQSLQAARRQLQEGSDLDLIKQRAVSHLNQYDGIKVEYLEAVSISDFRVVSEAAANQTVALCVAAWVGEVRLIDNIIV